jgi:hypothetical protein
MRTIRNLVGIAFVLTVLVGGQARVAAYQECTEVQRWCDTGHYDYYIACWYEDVWSFSCFEIAWEIYNW